MKKGILIFLITILLIVIIEYINYYIYKNKEKDIYIAGGGTRRVLKLEQWLRLEKNLSKIKIGDTIQRVKKLLGEPTFQQTSLDPKTGKIKTIILDYYLLYNMYAFSLNNMNLYITFYFSPNECLKAADTNTSLSIEHLRHKWYNIVISD